MNKRILLLGFGNMGQALARGWLASGRSADEIAIADPSSTAQQTARELGLAVLERNQSESFAPGVVVLAVKPVQLVDVKSMLESVDGPLLSIVAGRTFQDLAAVGGADRAIVRAMPNTPAAIRQGVTVLCANDSASSLHRETCQTLMSAVGQVAWIEDETLMDAVTAISGSGPAYVFLLIESLVAAALDLGLDAELAARLATATVAGAGAYAQGAEWSAADLRRRVTSPGGTTDAALAVLMDDDGLNQLISRAVEAAARRSRELSSETLEKD